MGLSPVHHPGTALCTASSQVPSTGHCHLCPRIPLIITHPVDLTTAKPALPRSLPVPEEIRTKGSSHLSAVTSSDLGRGL